ncbi:Colicin V production protein [Tindallia magadiensis]|uniref:Colicin V production protein n=1 Tax=Tindallia magadiensis TaxID=69895 RepID=A0A1I3GGI4_9FIRM|nr:CvpA family protein [Tindallia magadiensis]SFI22251.1 Colicin V production protein [Tindallia magadiensis]
MNWIDIMMIAILGWNLFRGYARGLILTIASLVSYMVGYWSASQFSYLVTERWINSPFLIRPIREWVYGYLKARWERPEVNHLAEENIQALWQQLPVPSVVLDWIPDYKEFNGLESAMELADDWVLAQATEALLHFLISCFSFLLVFIVVKQLVYMAGLVINGFFKLPVLNMANRMAGLAAGLIRGLILIWVITILLTPFAAANAQGAVAEALRQSALLPWLNNLMPSVFGSPESFAQVQINEGGETL